MRKKFLEKKLAKLKERMKELTTRALSSEDANEVRTLAGVVDDLKEEIEEVEEELASFEDEPVEERSAVPATATLVNGINAPVQREADPTASLEYRQAFMRYIQSGEWNYRGSEDGMIVTADIGKLIPKTIMTEFIKEIKSYGQLYNRVRKLNVKGGVEFPIEDLVPTVSWITETTPSSDQSAPEMKTSVSFGYHICEARIAQSLLAQVTSLEILEDEIAKILAEAFIREFDRVIVAGSGSGQPLGITVDERVPDANKIVLSATDVADWTKWRTKFFAKIPLAYRGKGAMVMTANTWESKIMTLKDSNNRPLYNETFNPVTGEMECTFAGRPVILVESDILKDYDTAGTGEAWAVYFRPNDYAINSNLEIGFKRYYNDDTNKWVNKGLAIMDGKLLDANGVFILKK